VIWKKDKEFEVRAESFLRDSKTPPASGHLRDYGLERIMARAEAASSREGDLRKVRIYRNPSLAHRLVLVGLLIPLLLILFTSGAYAFSSGAQPGTLMYGTKLFFEHARDTLTLSSESDIKLQIEYSDLRVSELEKMADPASNGGLDRWLQEYQANIDKVSGLLGETPSDSQLSQLFLDALDHQSEVMNQIRDTQPSAVLQIDEAYGICGQRQEQMRQRCGMSGAGNGPGQGQMQGDQPGSGQDSNQGTGSPMPGSGDGGQHMNDGGSQQGGNQGFNSGSDHQMGGR
jgi:hypothetical protein